MNTWQLGAADLARRIAAGEFTCRQVAEEALGRIAQVEPRVHALMRCCGEEALERAAGLDAQLGRGGKPGPLCGVPVVLKDNLCWQGHVTACSSKILENYRAPYTATVVERLLAAGAV